MNRKAGTRTRGLVARSALLNLLLAACWYGCAQTDAGEGTATNESALTIDDVQRELAPGAHGPEVGAVYGYLRSYGYFPNPALEASFPYWLPLVAEAPAEPSYYGAELADAVLAYQRQYGLEQTGLVDSATLTAMHTPRCGHPDNELAALDDSEKWALRGEPAYAPFNVRWGITLPNPHASAQVTGLGIQAGFITWEPVTNKTFSNNTNTREITVRFCPRTGTRPTDCPVFPTSTTRALGGFGEITFNTTDVTWDTVQKINLTATHEIGHALGISHSTASNAVMFPNPSTTTLAADDRHAIQVRYNVWELVNGLALDLAVGGTSSDPVVWVTSGGNSIWRFNPSTQSFQPQADTGTNGVSIAVSSSGVPWVTTTGNQIKRRNCAGVNDCNSGDDWTVVGNGTDIGIGGVPERIWAIGTTAQGGAGNFQVLRWNGSSFVAPMGGGFGTRVTVDLNGRPWVAQADGAVWRRNSADDGWEQVSTATSGCTRDLGAGGSSVYRIGCTDVGGGEREIFVWNEQGPNPCPTQPTDPECKRAWIKLDGAARRISGSPVMPGTQGANRGSIWVAQNSAAIFRRVSKPQ